MTMHLVHPGLSTTGKKRGKKKWASAEQKRQAEALEQSWNSLTQKWGATKSSKKESQVITLPTKPKLHVRDTGPRPQSLNSWHTGAVSSKPTQQYTGDSILGIGVLHKSCLQPIFSNQEAEDIAKMRR